MDAVLCKIRDCFVILAGGNFRLQFRKVRIGRIFISTELNAREFFVDMGIKFQRQVFLSTLTTKWEDDDETLR